MTENTASDPQGKTAEGAEAAPTYTLDMQPRRFKRVKLAVFLGALVACLSVAIIGFLVLALSAIFTGLGGMGAGPPTGAGEFGGGFLLAAQLSALNFILFFITIPAAAIVMGLSVARFPYQRIAGVKSYLRWGAIWGAFLVGGTTCLFGLTDSFASGLGALVGGASIGGVAGTFCGFLFHTIVQPARQLTQLDVSVF